jgi:hypothetical protein
MELVDSISRFLGKRWHCDARRISRQILAGTQDREPAWYSFELDDGGEQALFWLPGAIACGARYCRDVNGSFETVIRAVSLALGTLPEIDIPVEVRDRIAACLTWLRCQTTSDFIKQELTTECVEGVPCRAIDVFWNEMRLAKPADLASALFDNWVRDITNEDSSAALLDFAFRLRRCPPPLDVMRDARFVTMAFDTEICRIHWAVAECALEQHCPQRYVEELRSMLLVK